MKPIIIKMIKTFLLTGLIYAVAIAGYDYFSGNEFKLGKFIFNASFFGLIMALISRKDYKKQNSSKENQ
ncbi:hypothetical protein [Flavobacterium sp.]|uniref:hypothetical protein n=1 Tax=Flavobacterium sp. TaxID=239 RepID=UPI004047C959